MRESKSFSKSPGYYHWVPVIFIFLFVYLSIFSVNKSLLTTVKKSISWFKSFKILLKCRNSAPEVFCHRRVFCRCVTNFRGTYLCVGVISTKLQSGFVEMTLLRCCSPVVLLHVWGASSLENTCGGLLLNKDSFIYNF